MGPTIHFVVFILASILAFLWLIRFSLRHRETRPDVGRVIAVTGIVVIGGMLFAKYGNNIGLPWWIYYTVPALATLLLPPIAFRMKASEATLYVLLAFLSSPVIHVTFSLLFGWKEYMPFIAVPSLRELLR
jgi:hypothetical protein